jgi:hypothetical protein
MLEKQTLPFRLYVIAGTVALLLGCPAAVPLNATAATQGSGTPRIHRDSVRGFMRMAIPKVAVLGEELEIVLDVPQGTEDEDKKGVGLRWYVADEAGRRRATKEELQNGINAPGQVSPAETRPSRHIVKVRAPFQRPGRYELRMFRCPYYCTALLDGLLIDVVTGEDPKLLRLDKQRFKPGEAIDVTVTLPPNRYYFGHWSGPTVQLVPIEIGGRSLTSEEAAAWLQRCSSPCSTWLSFALTNQRRNPLDGGYDAIPGTYRIKMTEMAKANKIAHPLYAPAEAGRYQVRLYDRGFPWKWQDFSDLYMASHEIVVEALDKAAATAKPPAAKLYFVRRTDSGLTRVSDQTLRYGDRFAIELEFDGSAESAGDRRRVKLEWGQEASQQREIVVERDKRARNLFRSEILILEKP